MNNLSLKQQVTLEIFTAMVSAGASTENKHIRDSIVAAENFLELTNEKEKKGEKRTNYIYHGGCLGCTQQELHGVDFCVGCQYFLPNWSLPSLSNKFNASEQKRIEIMERLQIETTVEGNFTHKKHIDCSTCPQPPHIPVGGTCTGC